MPRCRKSSAFNVAVDLCTYNDNDEKEDQLSGEEILKIDFILFHSLSIPVKTNE